MPYYLVLLNSNGKEERGGRPVCTAVQKRRAGDDPAVHTRLAPAAANGGSKKYYSLTDKGRETLEELAAFWREYAACVDGFLQRWKEELA